MPITGAGTKQDPRRPKYSDPLREFNWTMIDFGAEPACMLGVGDIPDGVHSVLANYPDCVALPLNLDNQIGAQITQARNVIEALNIPANWVQETHTYRQVARVIASMFAFGRASMEKSALGG